MIKCVAIDDDPIFLKLLKSFFKRIEHCELIGTYDNPVDGVIAVVKYKPQVLLLDLEMPYMDGFESLDTLDNRPKILMISAHLDRPDLPKGMDINKYIDKSMLTSPDYLEKVIHEVLED